MQRLARSARSVLLVFVIIVGLMLAMVAIPEVHGATCSMLKSQLPNFCLGGEFIPPKAETIWQRLSAVSPQALVARWNGMICVTGSTAVPVKSVDTSDLGKIITTGIDWLSASGHNTFRSQDMKICSEFAVPVYLELAKVKVQETALNSYDIWLPVPTIGDPAPIGEPNVTVDPKVLSERGIRQEQLLQENLTTMTKEARTQAQASIETRNAALCQGMRQFVAALSSLQGIQYQIKWGGEYINCQ